MKAEPESRLEKGHDIKFSIDDLASKTEPEPWDGKPFHPYYQSAILLTSMQAFEHTQVPSLRTKCQLDADRSSTQQPPSYEARRPSILLPFVL
jgi:hypothetical protein